MLLVMFVAFFNSVVVRLADENDLQDHKLNLVRTIHIYVKINKIITKNIQGNKLS